MFKSLLNSWKQANGTILKEDFIRVSNALLNKQGNMGWAQKTFYDLHNDVTTQHGNLSEIPEKIKKKISEELKKGSKKLYKECVSKSEMRDLCMGQAYAILLYSLWVESTITPGEDAKFVEESLSGFLEECKENTESMRKEINERFNK